MALRRCSTGIISASIFLVGIWLLGSVTQATAETLNLKFFTHVTKTEMVPIADVEGHFIGVSVREGVTVFENGELGWVKAALILDLIKGAGTFDSYATYTLMDGSTFTVRNKGTMEATSQGVSTGAKRTGDIICGTGRFQGIKGTITSSTKLLPPEKGERERKALSEGTLVYTLPSK